MWERLPEAYRTLDAPLGYPLRAYLSLVGDQLEGVEATVAAVAPASGRSALSDPMAAAPEWLPWMAQLVGANLSGAATVAQRRAAVAGAGSGWLAGTMAGVVAAVRSTLTDPVGGYVSVTRDASDMWLLHVVTKATETPDPAASLRAVIQAGAKPAGVVLDWAAYAASWDDIEALAPTWAAIEALGSWGALEAAG